MAKYNTEENPPKAKRGEKPKNTKRENTKTYPGGIWAGIPASPQSRGTRGANVGVYRQACSGIPLAVRFVGRDRLLWNSIVQRTQKFRQVQAASCVIPYVLCGGLYCLRCWCVLRGSLPTLIYSVWQGYMESPSRVQLESYYNTIV